MATTIINTPISTGAFELDSRTNAPSIQQVEMSPGVYFNISGQTSPNHTFVWFSELDPSGAAKPMINSTSVLVPNMKYNIQESRVFKASDTKVMVIHGVNSPFTYQYFTVDVGSKTISSWSTVKTLSSIPSISTVTLNFTASYTSFTPLGDGGYLMTSGSNTTNGLWKMTMDPVAETVSFSVALPTPFTAYADTYLQYLPLRNQYILRGTAGTPVNSVFTFNATTGASVVTSVSFSTIFSSNSVFTPCLLSDGSWVAFSSDCRTVYTGSGTTNSVKRSIAVLDTANVGTSFNPQGSSQYGYSFGAAIDDSHFMVGYLEFSGAFGQSNYTQANKPTNSLPSALRIRYIEKVNDDVWRISDNSKAGSGYSVNIPTTDTVAPTSPYTFWNILNGSEGFQMTPDWKFQLAYDNGNRITKLDIK